MDTANDVINLILGILMCALGVLLFAYLLDAWRRLRRRDIDR